jgi:hypothetical protein
MAVVGIDAHKTTHTAVLVDELGRQIAVKTVRAHTEGHLTLLGVSTMQPIRWMTRAKSVQGSAPRIRMRPPLARTSPRRHRRVVVLPAPLGPRNRIRLPQERPDQGRRAPPPCPATGVGTPYGVSQPR